MFTRIGSAEGELTGRGLSIESIGSGGTALDTLLSKSWLC